MNVAFVASEVVPFAKTGGLADVAGALPKELSKLKCNVKVFMPLYGSIKKQNLKLNYVWSIGKIKLDIGGEVRNVEVWQIQLKDSDVQVYFIDYPKFFKRKDFYTNSPDEHLRWILFNKAVIETIQRLQWSPDIIHLNDWQGGLIPLYIKENYNWDKFFQKTKTIFSIHNIGYQGLFPANIFNETEINSKHFYPTGPVEYYEKISLLKAGLVFSDLINTVSETYAKEILTEEYGGGMHEILNDRKSDLSGIVNGVDYEIWNPKTDPNIYKNYTSAKLSDKEINKEELLKEAGLPYNKTTPVIGMISRIVSQKGYDILAEALPELTKLDVQWVILGSGEKKYERLMKKVARKFPDNVSIIIGYNDVLSHKIEAGADYLLMPSLYEPCGLNQIFSLKYGTIPIVRNTGGLADTVIDWDKSVEEKRNDGTGFVFDEYSGHALFKVIERAAVHFNNKKVWRSIQKNAMKKDYSWKASAKKYIELYEKAIEK
ncbi:MAG: glycogen synthase GlgA [Melioribacteraceae bacterium]|nr:glycogen synthase GlgA [Melioribacteraceae bacterium]